MKGPLPSLPLPPPPLRKPPPGCLPLPHPPPPPRPVPPLSASLFPSACPPLSLSRVVGAGGVQQPHQTQLQPLVACPGPRDRRLLRACAKLAGCVAAAAAVFSRASSTAWLSRREQAGLSQPGLALMSSQLASRCPLLGALCWWAAHQLAGWPHVKASPCSPMLRMRHAGADFCSPAPEDCPAMLASGLLAGTAVARASGMFLGGGGLSLGGGGGPPGEQRPERPALGAPVL